MTDTRHLIGLLLGTENDWPSVFEHLVRRLGRVEDGAGTGHSYDVERITVEPFDLRYKPSYDLVIDRLAYWYYHPREWLKKVALMDDVYLLNSPFTFQAMEKHAAYCAMMRLGLKVPTTALVPYKNPVDHAKYAYTAERYNRSFDLDAVAEHVGYPLFMKPYDGGAWVGVSRIRDADDLHRAYDESGEMLMHLQASVEGYDVFARSLSIGAETMVMNFDPDQPMHARYSVSHDFLTPEVGAEVVSIGRIVNSFFRWEFNSCETLVAGTEVHPIDYANACPDVAITSLHYYFPWAMKALLRWSVFCTATGRTPMSHVDPAPWFTIADRDRPVVRGEAGGLRRAGRRLLRHRALPRLLRLPARATSTRWPSSTSSRRSSTRCSSRPSRRRSRPTSTTSSSRTTAACSPPGAATSAAGWPTDRHVLETPPSAALRTQIEDQRRRLGIRTLGSTSAMRLLLDWCTGVGR